MSDPNNPQQCNPEQCRYANQIVQMATKQAQHDLFHSLGIDADRPEQLEELRSDMRFGRMMRKAANKGFTTAVMLGLTAILVAALMSVSSKFGGGG